MPLEDDPLEINVDEFERIFFGDRSGINTSDTVITSSDTPVGTSVRFTINETPREPIEEVRLPRIHWDWPESNWTAASTTINYYTPTFYAAKNHLREETINAEKVFANYFKQNADINNILFFDVSNVVNGYSGPKLTTSNAFIFAELCSKKKLFAIIFANSTLLNGGETVTRYIFKTEETVTFDEFMADIFTGVI